MRQTTSIGFLVHSFAAAVVMVAVATAAGNTGLARQALRQEPSEKEAAASASDVATIDAIVAALYDVISGPAGKKRDWDRFRSLFATGARLIPTGDQGARVLGVEDYIASSGGYLETNGFFEREIARKTEKFGRIAHLFSTYEARNRTEDPTPFMRGINSIQLVNDGRRWWIVTILWQRESESNLLPSEYLERPAANQQGTPVTSSPHYRLPERLERAAMRDADRSNRSPGSGWF